MMFQSDYGYVRYSLVRKEKYLVLDMINIADEYLNMGYGNKLLQKWINYIKEKYSNFDRIELKCSPDFGSDIWKLAKWYSKFGFELLPNQENEREPKMVYKL